MRVFWTAVYFRERLASFFPILSLQPTASYQKKAPFAGSSGGLPEA